MRKSLRHPLLRSFLLIALLASHVVLAHPEDDFCTPGDDSMDPALCAALAELNSAEGKLQQTDMPSVLDEFGNERGIGSTAVLYVTIGARHILPDGLDHILFVLAIFLASVRFRALIIQVSAFTVAHTMTLALAASGVITPSPAVVEPLIALTIGFVAVENLFFKEMTKWRPAVVFSFGLVHGMGFAGFFGDLGLPPGQFWSALISFNVGVEIGQLLVIAAAALLGLGLRRVLHDPTGARQYRQFVVLPSSALIGFVGFWWAAVRFIQ
jgi:hypothetical protein